MRLPAVTDLNYLALKGHALGSNISLGQFVDVYWKACFSTGNGFSASTYFSSLRSTLQRQPVHQKLSCQDQYRSMASAQLTYRESLRDLKRLLNCGNTGKFN